MTPDSETLALSITEAGVLPLEDGSQLHAIWTLAWPVILAMLSESLISFVDMVMVSRLGPTAVAAVGVGGQILNAMSIVMAAVGTGTLAIVARHVGAGEPHKASAVIAQSILTALVLATVLIIPVAIFVLPLVSAFGLEPAVAESSASFTQLVLLSVPTGAVLFVIGSALRGAGDTRTPLAIGIVVNLVNLFLNWALIFGHFGFPALGVRGSAIATASAFALGAVIGLGLLLSKRLRLTLHLRQLRPHFPTIRRVLRIGSPAALEQGLMQIGFFIYLAFAIRYGTDAVAAYFIGVRILALSFLPGFGFAAAAAALVGQNLGAGRPEHARRAGWLASWLAVGLMTAAGIGIVLGAEPIAHIFVDNPVVIASTVSFIVMLGIAQPFMALDSTLSGALRGAGDTRFPLLTVLITFYGIRLGLSWIVVSIGSLGIAWLWATLIGDYIARAALKGWRFRQGAWASIRV